MSVLSDRSLRAMYPDREPGPASIDLHLGDSLLYWPEWNIRDPRVDQSEKQAELVAVDVVLRVAAQARTPLRRRERIEISRQRSDARGRHAASDPANMERRESTRAVRGRLGTGSSGDGRPN
jgi:hypothetical protein